MARDALGVPHIQAAAWEDAIFLQGYVTAQDRLWQMDALRRLAAGELAEVIGPAALDVGPRIAPAANAPHRRRALSGTLPPADRAVFAAYARGVNYFIETHRDNLPLEFTLLRYDPRPWRIEDTHAVRLADVSHSDQLPGRKRSHKMHMLAEGDAGQSEFPFPGAHGHGVAAGSNAWAISGTHTASGKPILANDPHLEFSIPSPWYQVHLQAPGLNVTGVSLPGVPA